MNKVTVRELILSLHNFPLDSEIRVKDKDGNYVEGATLYVINDGLGALFG